MGCEKHEVGGEECVVRTPSTREVIHRAVNFFFLLPFAGKLGTLGIGDLKNDKIKLKRKAFSFSQLKIFTVACLLVNISDN